MPKLFNKMIFSSFLFSMCGFTYGFEGSFYGIPFTAYVGPGASFQTRQSDDIRNISWHPRILAGVGTTRSWFYIGAEAYYDPVTINHSNIEVDGVNLKTTYDVGLSIIPGVWLDNVVMPYLRLGVVNTYFTYPDVSKTGQEGGAGLEVRVAGCLSVRAEYDYVYYHKVTNIGDVRSNNYAASVIYHF